MGGILQIVRSRLPWGSGNPQLLRRVIVSDEFLYYDGNLSRWVPKHKPLRFDADGMSTFERGLLEANKHGCEDVATLGGTKSQPAVVFQIGGDQITKRVARADNAHCRIEPSPNDVTPIGYAHWSIQPPEDVTQTHRREIQRELAERMSLKLVHGSVTLPKPNDVL